MITTVCKISYGSQTVPPIVPAVQGDTGRAISFEIADFTPPAGATATYFILKPSGEAIYNSATITDNSILCELTAQSLAEAGENRMQVRVIQGENIVTSFEVILMVRSFLGDDAIESGTEMNIFDQAVEQATEQFQEQAEEIVEEVLESIPEDYTALTEEVDELNERIGDEIDNVYTDIQALSDLANKIIPDWTWELGSYNSDGVPTTNDKRVRSGKQIISRPLTLYVDEGYRYYVHYYASEDAVRHDTTKPDGGVSGWITTSYTIDANTWFAVTIAKTAESEEYTASTDWGDYVYSVVDSELVTTVVSNTERIGTIESQLNEILPDYWLTYLDSKKSSIITALADIGNHGDVFTYFTDYHAPLNAGHTADILKYINNNVDMRKNIFGGDILTNHPKAEALTILNTFASDFMGLKLLSTNGNHEYNRYSGDTADRLTDAEWYAFLLGDNELDRRINEMSPNGYYYIDNSVQKIRYIFLNTNYSVTQFSIDTAQIQWIIDTLNSVKANWSVVIFTHWYYGTVNADYTLSRDGIGDAIKAICDGYSAKTTGTVIGIEPQYNVSFDFTNANGEMICVICGHTHNDYAEKSASGYWVIATMCDAYHGSQQNPAVARTLGTISEQAIDLFFIDKTERAIKTIRIGAGQDRSFTY